MTLFIFDIFIQMASLGVAATVASPLCAQIQSHSIYELFHTKHSHPCGGCLFREILSDMVARRNFQGFK